MAAHADAPVNGPVRGYRSMIMNSARWDDFRPRDGDVIVATYPKCGTTWTQRIVSLLIHQSPAPRDIMGEAPWVDTTLFGPAAPILATLEAQTHRRSMKMRTSRPRAAGPEADHRRRRGHPDRRHHRDHRYRPGHWRRCC